MLRKLEIENYQSLRKLSLVLGRLTVITGPSSSGKTAAIRALRMLAFNARGTSYISRGQKSCRVALELDGIGDADHPDRVELTRSARGGGDAYCTERMADRRHSCGAGMKYTKLGGQVPPQVSGMLRLAPLNFADQFDRPFLLDSSGGEVARTLGSLTNVIMIFRAGQEAGRRKLALSAELKARRAGLAALQERAQQFAGLAGRQAAVSEAESALASMGDAAARAQRLRELTAALGAAQAQAAAVTVPEVPDAGPMLAAAARSARLCALVAGHAGAHRQLAAAGQALASARADSAEAAALLRTLLEEAGYCPVCGQEVHAA